VKKSKFTEIQIVSILKQADAGVPVEDICRHSMSVCGRLAVMTQRFLHRSGR
jgi:hypothetical protein